MGQTPGHMTGKPVTNAMKPADVQLQAFCAPKAEFPRPRTHDIDAEERTEKFHWRFQPGSRGFIDENVSNKREHRTAVVWHNDRLFPTRPIPPRQRFPATAAADDNK